MGSAISSENQDNFAAFEIQNIIKELIKNYEVWTDPEKCNKMELVYKNKLMHFSDSMLYDISLLLGHKYEKNKIPREKLCDLIVNHYKSRIELLRKINKGINRCADMIKRASNGEVCRNTTKYIDDFFTCNTIPKAIWINKEEYSKILERLRKDDRLENMTNWIEQLQEHYYGSLQKLLDIVTVIKQDIDNTLSFIEFQAIQEETDVILRKMNQYCEIYYLLAINSR